MIRLATINDISRLIDIYNYAKIRMLKNGNPQWENFIPTYEYFTELIKENNFYVCYSNEYIYGAFIFRIGIDETYIEIDGNWLNDLEYGVIHRLVSDYKQNHVFKEIFDFCLNKASNIRIDTHENNLIMKHLLNKMGFIKCGIIKLKDGSLRIAYQYERN